MSLFFPKKKETQKKPAKVGDLIFFFLLLFFSAVAYTGLSFIPQILINVSYERLFQFSIALLFGAAIAHFFLRAHISVFIHECKHMIASLLAGDKPKGMRVRGGSGHYEYEYSDDTKSFNAFISLAPYCLPLFTTILFAPSLYFLRNTPDTLVVILGLGYGMDLVLCLRDISPIQTDFSNLRGGFGLGVLYVLAIHICVALVIMTWVLTGITGLEKLFLLIFSNLGGKGRG